MKRINLSLLLFIAILSATGQVLGQGTIARQWIDLNLYAVRNDLARPTVTARNLWHTSAAMYEAWSVYDGQSSPYFLGNIVDGFPVPFDGIEVPDNVLLREEHRQMAISYAAYRLLKHRYSNLPGTNQPIIDAALDSKMEELSYDINITSVNYTLNGPAALGNYIAEQIIAFGLQDGASELDEYENQYYESIYNVPPNVPTWQSEALVTNSPGNPTMVDPNRWQPLTLLIAIDQLGNPIPVNTPGFLSPEWGNVTPFSLTDDDNTIYERDGNLWSVYCDPGMPPLIDTITPATGLSDPYKWGNALVLTWSSLMDHENGVMIDISPNNIGAVPSYPTSIDEYDQFYDLLNGTDPSLGYSINPKTNMPYEEQLVPMGDYARVLAEFWADGPDSETPPGHWFSILNYVNEQEEIERRWNGQGPQLTRLDWDIKSYFTMGAALHDCAIAAWGIKGYYDYVRPISAIRWMADMGQSTDEALANYNPAGLPLIEGQIELVAIGDPLVGASNEHLNKIKVKAWKGPDYLDQIGNNNEPLEPILDSTIAGVDWILGENWWPYQRPTFVTPPFAGYVSGHSTYSRGAAEVLALMTGDEYFPGGIGEFECEQDDFLEFETGPSVPLTLQWAKYSDASDQCSLSRIFGGIHPPADDIPGRIIGEKIGIKTFELASSIMHPIPLVTNSNVSQSLINDDATASDFTLTYMFSLNMDTDVSPVITFDQDISQTLSLSSASWVELDTYELTYNLTDANVTIDNVYAEISGAVSLNGVDQESPVASDMFNIDTENPEAILCEFGENINESSVGSQVDLTLNFSEDMAPALPQLNFSSEDPLLNSLTLSATQSEWLSATEYVFSYDVLDANEEFFDMNLTVAGLQDNSGNDIVLLAHNIDTYIDTKAPSFVSIVPNVSTINEGQVGNGMLSIEVTMDNILDLDSLPLISFPAEDPTGSLVFDQAASSYSGDSSYIFVFNVVDENLELAEIDILVSNFTDLGQNVSEEFLAIDALNVDTKAPELTLSAFNVSLITDAETGSDYEVTFTYNEPMDTEDPIIEFTPGTPGSLIYDSGTWESDMVYKAIYTIVDDNEEALLSISISGASDQSGNDMLGIDLDEELVLDNRNPEATIMANVYNVTSTNQSDGFQITVAFDEDMNQAVLPAIDYPVEDPFGNITETGISNWLSSSEYLFDYTVDDLTPLPNIDIAISDAEDIYGNVLNGLDVIDFFSVDFSSGLTLNELELKKFRVYPNPVSVGANFIIDTEDVLNYSLVIYDVTGRQVAAQWKQTSNYQIEIETIGLDSGKYFIELQNSEQRIVLRIEVL